MTMKPKDELTITMKRRIPFAAAIVGKRASISNAAIAETVGILMPTHDIERKFLTYGVFMKITRLAAAATLLANLGSVHAADDPATAFYKWWGVVDVNVGHMTNQDQGTAGEGSVLSIGQGGMYGSRIGVNGKSAPVDGVRAIFNLEGGVALHDASTLAFNRYALVGLESKAGMIRGGTMLKPYDDTAWNYEPMESMGFSLGSLTSWRGFGSTTKTVRLDSAAVGGFKASAFYSFGGVADNTTAKSRYGVLGTASIGLVDVLAYYESGANADGKRTETTQSWNGSTGTMTALQAKAKVGTAATVYLGYNGFGAPDAAAGKPTKSNVVFAGVGYQATDKLNLKLGAYKFEQSDIKDQGATQLALGAQYNIGVATVYGVVGHLENQANGKLSLDGAPDGAQAGAAQNGVKVGIVYVF